ncbi:hypothetical protein [Kitasatospora cineracea]|uniref:hypothetical protein n=1 Tax=Kitasatospora cineracea TaxID=88074 RepID=UPI0034040B08
MRINRLSKSVYPRSGYTMLLALNNRNRRGGAGSLAGGIFMSAISGPISGSSLAAKLAFLRSRLAGHGGCPPSTRTLAARTTGDSGKPLIDHTVIHATLNGDKTNPPSRTILGLAQAFDCPPAYLLPGSDDLESLEVYYEHEKVREALRLIAPLGESGADGLLQAARAMRAARGMTTKATPLATPETPTGAKPKRRRRLTRAEAAEASRQSMYSLYD